MKKQNFELKNEQIRAAFDELKRNHPERLERRLAFSWSNWGFGLEPLEESAARLERAESSTSERRAITMGRTSATRWTKRCASWAITASRWQVCGCTRRTATGEQPLDSSRDGNRVSQARDPVYGGGRRKLLAGDPRRVGRPTAYDDTEFDRSVEAIRVVADLFTEYGVRGSVEPVRSAEVSLLHTVADVCA